tara:strand:+ start:2967 stop:3959 length:993 start_codon:yes stop_codon:yes gene_type:complete
MMVSGWISLVNGASVFSLPASMDKVVARNASEANSATQIFWNTRLQKKKLFVDPAFKWKSLFTSLTMSDVGKEFPIAGMNEKGLVIHNVSKSQSTENQTLYQLQWLQMILDTSSDLASAIFHASSIAASLLGENAQFIVCDWTGECGIFESHGIWKIRSGDEVSYPVLTESSYDESLEFLSKHEGYGGELPIPQGVSSLERFVRMVFLSSRYDSSESSLNFSFRLLDQISQPSTQWNSVFHVRLRQLYFKKHDFNKTKWIQMEVLPVSCQTELISWKIKTDEFGDQSKRGLPWTDEKANEFISNYPLFDENQKKAIVDFSLNQVNCEEEQ